MGQAAEERDAVERHFASNTAGTAIKVGQGPIDLAIKP
jgi:hypothetical protein